MRRAVAAAVAGAVCAGGVLMPLLPRSASAGTPLCSDPVVQQIMATAPGPGQTAKQQHGPPGSTVTITGQNFTAQFCAVSSVSIGSHQVQAAQLSASATQITFTTTAGMDGDVTVTVRDTTTNTPIAVDSHLVYITDPTFTGLDNTTPPTGATVHLNGQGFDFQLPQNWELTSAGYHWTAGPTGPCPAVPAGQPSVSSDAQIALQVPSQYCDGAVDIDLSAPYDTTRTGPGDPRMQFRLTAPFDIATQVTGKSRTSAVPGQSVVVTGSGFGSQGGAATVNGEPAAVQSWGDSAVTVVVPARATSGVLNLTRSVDSAPFTPGALTVAAQANGISPAKASIGDTVTVSGAGFGPSTGTVQVGSTTATVQTWTPNSIAFTVPDGATTNPVNIGTNGTTPPTPPGLTVVPRITGVTPPDAAPGALIEVDGTTFGTQQGAVQVGGQPAQVTLWGDRAVLVVVPAGLAQGPSTVMVAPPGNDSVTAPYTINAPPPTPTAAPGSGSGSPASGPGRSAGSGSGTALATPGLILPSSNGPVIAQGPVNFVKPPPPPGPVSLKLDTVSGQADPGNAVAFTVTLIAFGKPVPGAPVDLVMVIEPGSDAGLDPAHGVTDDQGQLKGTIHLSHTPGDHIVLARSGIYSDEVRVVGRGARVAAAPGSAPAGVSVPPSTPPLVSVRSPVMWALAACLLLFGAGFGLNLLTAPAAGPAVTGSGRPVRGVRATLLDSMLGMGSAARFAAGVVAVAASLALGALRRP
ncbi:MAG TPA: IPT/TIG domain-containing protein [Candidatus Dormibacteraeota bacterium]|jgi:hypothetical protein|nr:IPT/TIG domain-containing protein [Candidatus Dormibacteraeota bacterium]